MNYLKQLFARKPKQPALPHSTLAAQLSRLSDESKQWLSTFTTEPVLTKNFTEALATLILCAAHRKTEKLFALWRKNAGKKTALPTFCYDDVCIEFAAIAHYWLLRNYLNYEDVDYIVNQETYFQHLNDAILFSENVFLHNTSHATPDFFQQKVMSYGAPTSMPKDAVLTRLIIRAHAKQNNSMDLPYLEKTARYAAQQFFNYQLSELETSVSTFFQQAQSRYAKAG